MSTLYSQTLNADSGGWNGYTSVLRFETAALTLPTDAITRTRVRFEAGAGEALTITDSYIGHAAAAGDAYDFLDTPVQLLWSASATIAISAGTTATSDWASFVYNKTSALLIATYIGGGTSVDTYRYKASVSNFDSYFKNSSDAATVNKTGYTGPNDDLLGVNLIEVETATGGFFLFMR